MSHHLDLQLANQHCRLLADSTRLRLLLLLEEEELSVAELAAITQLAQPRVSTHLAKLKEAHLVNDRRDGVSVYYRITDQIPDPGLDALWSVLRQTSDDPMAQQDRQRAAEILAARAADNSWADSVAGDMERHYSPGRTWEATTRALTQLIKLGDVLDIASGDGVLAELLAPRATAIHCIDLSERVVAAGEIRVGHLDNVSFQLGDMHQLPFDDECFDQALLMHALTYTAEPESVFAQVHRVLRPGGQMLAVTLGQHQHEKAVLPFGHKNMGFTPERLTQLCRQVGLTAVHCSVAAVEKRAPNFSVLTLMACKPASAS